MSSLAIVILCVASAVGGRLLLTRDQAVRTIAVRLPTLLAAIIFVAAGGLGLLIFAAMCLVGGSFFGLRLWWLPVASQFWDSGLRPLLTVVASGSWE